MGGDKQAVIGRGNGTAVKQIDFVYAWPVFGYRYAVAACTAIGGNETLRNRIHVLWDNLVKMCVCGCLIEVPTIRHWTIAPTVYHPNKRGRRAHTR